MVSYVAFLRGINVGGHHRLKMADLRRAFESWGLQKVKTLLASGNVIFDAPGNDPDALAARLSQGIRQTFGMDIGVLVRTLTQIRDLVDQDPFRQITVTPQSRLYVTLLPGNSPGSRVTAGESPETGFQILRVSASEVCSVLTLDSHPGTIKAMDLLEKEFGQNITTRNWNTITRIARMAGETR